MVDVEFLYVMHGLTIRDSEIGRFRMDMKLVLRLTELIMMDRIPLKIAGGQTGRSREIIGELVTISKSAKYKKALLNGLNCLVYLQIRHSDDMPKDCLWNRFFMTGGC